MVVLLNDVIMITQEIQKEKKKKKEKTARKIANLTDVLIKIYGEQIETYGLSMGGGCSVLGCD